MAKKNLRSEIAKKAYLDPKSSTFLNKTQSMIVAGYSETYAEHRGWEVLDNTKFTDADLANFKTLVQGLPKLVALTNKKMKQLAQSDAISAKNYSVILRHIELIAKCTGILKERIERREEIIKISVPGPTKCPKCGHMFPDIVEEERRRIESKER